MQYIPFYWFSKNYFHRFSFSKKLQRFVFFVKKTDFEILWQKNQRMYENEQNWRFWYFSQYFRYTHISRKILNCENMASFLASLILEKQGTFFRICRIDRLAPKLPIKTHFQQILSIFLVKTHTFFNFDHIKNVQNANF